MLPYYGRRLSRKTKKFNYSELEKYEFFLNKSKFEEIARRFATDSVQINLEIGFGTGDNIIYQSEVKKEDLFLACDPFISGSIKLKKTIEKKKIKNVYFNNLDFLDFSNQIKNIIFRKVFILFPDPWRKKKHNKRRLINKEFVNILEKVTSKKSEIFVATDSEDYSRQISESFLREKYFTIEHFSNELSSYNFNISPTKYYIKAKSERKKINFFIFRK